MKKQTVYSALQPTGTLTIGNYIGAVKNMVYLQGEYDCYYSVADLHSLTVETNPQNLIENSYRLYSMLLAFGIKNSTFFVQSHVPEHSQLAWVLGCYTQIGEAKRMTQFKDKSAKNSQNINVGLFEYPVLMAADILLYSPQFVPIGKDQKQHLELSRVIAERFNSRHGKTFEIPDGIFPKYGAKINSLLNPFAKMSKTEDPNGAIFITDTDDEILKKFKRAVTDSDTQIRYDMTNKAGISNLLTIYSAFTGTTISDAEKDLDGLRYGDFKMKTAEAVIEALKPIKSEYEKLLGDRAYLHSEMKRNAVKARERASVMMNTVYNKCGLIQC